MNARDRAPRILQRLIETYHAQRDGAFLHFTNPLELLVATILSAQCTDARVNTVTPTLFARYPTARDYATADLQEIQHIIHPTGFYRQKARALKENGRILCERFHGEVPCRMDDLLTLRGVSHKTANIVLAKGCGISAGIAVDTHVARISRRLDLTRHSRPLAIARALERLFPSQEYLAVNEYFILHGRATCRARAPRCAQCCIAQWCPRRGVSPQSRKS